MRIRNIFFKRRSPWIARGKFLDAIGRDLGLERRIKKLSLFRRKESDRSYRRRLRDHAVYLYVSKQKDR